jgi:hypothetical protein
LLGLIHSLPPSIENLAIKPFEMQFLLLAAFIASGSVFPSLTAAFNVSDIELATKENWCQHQLDGCGPLCALENLEATENKCYPENLYYACVCSNGSRPNLTEYSETIPYYTCTLDQGDCIKNCGSGGNDCIEQCKKTYVCGATNPKKGNATKSSSAKSSTASKTGSPTSTSTDSSDMGGSQGGSSAGSLLVNVNSAYGLGVVAAGIAAGVALVGF